MDRSLLLAAAGVKLQNRLETRSDLLADLQKNPALIRLIRPTHSEITAVRVSPDGRLLAVADTAGAVRFIDLASWKPRGAGVRLSSPVAGRTADFRLGGMDFGVGYFPTHDGLSPGAIARVVEERGHESLFFAEHTHIPASRESPWPGGEKLPPKYFHTYDLFVALTAAAAATSRLRVGSGICLIVERDPITTAKEVASVDHLSGGRLEFGIGAGWNREEMRNHGTDPRTRMRLMAERVEAMKAIWTHEEASYSGEFVSFERIWSWPKPAQRPHPPVLVGGNGPTVLDRVLAFGDAWFPNYGRGGGDIAERAAELRARADRHIDVIPIGVPADPGVLERLDGAGCRRAICWLPSGGLGAVVPALERWESAIAQFTGEA